MGISHAIPSNIISFLAGRDSHFAPHSTQASLFHSHSLSIQIPTKRKTFCPFRNQIQNNNKKEIVKRVLHVIVAAVVSVSKKRCRHGEFEWDQENEGPNTAWAVEGDESSPENVCRRAGRRQLCH